MTGDQFQAQIRRLTNAFGPNATSTERTKLIWREVADFGDAWFEKTIDGFIGNCRQAPLVADFTAAASQERERLWQVEKRVHAVEAKDAWGNYTREQLKSICDDIRGLIMRPMPKEPGNG